MPLRVPRRDTTQRPTLQPGPAGPGPSQIPREAFGAGQDELFRTAAALPDDQRRIMQEELDRAHDLKLREEDTLFRAESDRLRLRYKTEFQGKQAVESDLVGMADEEWGEFFDKRLEEGVNLPERTKLQLQLRADQYRQNLRSFARAHTAQEREVYEKAVFDGQLQGFLRSVTVDPSSPNVTESILGGLHAINSRAKEAGMPQEWIDAKERSWRSTVVRRAVETMIQEKDISGAARFFEQNRDELTLEDRKALTPHVKRAGNLDRALAVVDKLMLDPEMTLTKGFDAIKEIEDGDLRKAAEEEFKNQFRNKLAGERFDEDQRLEEFTKRLRLSGGDLRGPLLDPEWMKLSEKSQAALRKFASQLQRRVPVETDWEFYAILRTEAEADPEKFLERVPHQWINNLAPPQFTKMVDLYAEMSGKKKGDLTDTFMTEMQYVNMALRRLGIDPKSKSQDDIERIGTFHQFIARAVRSAQVESGQKIKEADLEKLVDDARKRTVLLYGTKSRAGIHIQALQQRLAAGLVLEDERERAYVPLDDPDFSEEQKQIYRNKLTNLQRRVTDDKLERLRAAHLMEDRDLFKKILLEP
jgi:hypothetical protein